MPVRRQLDKLAEALTWRQTGTPVFEDGEWYFAGPPMLVNLLPVGFVRSQSPNQLQYLPRMF